MRLTIPIALLLLIGFRAAHANAQEDDATKNAARELAQQAMEASAGGDHTRAQDLFHRAYALVPAPTLAVREARSLVALGRWVEAVEAYVRATRTRLDPSASPAFREAVRQAQDELAALRPRVPRLKIELEGIDRKNPALTVRVDGKPWPPALLGVPSPIDPGAHEIVAETTGGHRDSKHVGLRERESKSVTLVLPPQAASDPPVDAAAAPSVTREKPPSAKRDRTLAFVGFGVGAAGLAIGVGAGLVATSKHGSAEDSCPGGRCTQGSGGADDVDAFHRFRTISTVGYVVAVVGVGAGVTLWLTAPSHSEPVVGAFAGPGSAGVRGAF